MSRGCKTAAGPLGHRSPRDEAGRLPADKLRQVQRYARTLLDGVAVAEQVDEDWPEFYRLADAFTEAHGSSRLKRLRAAASLFEGWGDDDLLTDEDRAFLVRLFNEVQDVLRARASAEASAPRGDDAEAGAR